MKKLIYKILYKWLFVKKFGGNIFSDLYLNKFKKKNISGYTKFLHQKIKYNDASSFLTVRKEIFENESYKFIADNQSPIIIDCGSNIGVSVIYFKTLYPDCKIIAFEPDANLFNILCENINIFSLRDVKAFNKAIWTNNNGVIFKLQGGLSGKISDKENDNTIFIESISLNTILQDYETIDFLKIDIEGAEDKVINNITNENITKIKYLFVEYHSESSKTQVLNELLSKFTKNGFRYHIKEAYTREHPFISKQTQLSMDLQLDIFCINERC